MKRRTDTRQLSLWSEPEVLAQEPLCTPLAPVPKLPQVIHHQTEIWFRDFRPNVMVCDQDPSAPKFGDESWSAQWRGAYLPEECVICHPELVLDMEVFQ